MNISAECAAQSIGPANQLFASLVQTILAAQCAISPPELWPEDYGPDALKSGLPDFDFIVVGAGSAGSVVASRLSENPIYNVLLLEAGGDPPIESEIPNLFFVLQNPNSTTNWGYFAEKSDIASKNFPKGVHWPRGRMLGGSHGYNGMVYVRGNDRDFNQWEQAGNPTWGWEDVLHYFKKSEGMQMEDVLKADTELKYHNADGPLKIDSFHCTDVMRDVVIEAGNELGYKHLIDMNADQTIGITNAHGTLDGNRRCTTAKAFLVPSKDRTNLYIMKHAHVTKVNINEEKTVTGVQFIWKNRKMVAHARKEVILSAGAINTPQILLLSGVGPKAELDRHNIPQIVDLPVGKNLQDHPYVSLPLSIKKVNDSFKYDKGIIDTLYKHIQNEYGPSGNGLFDLLGFFNTHDKDDKYPDIGTHYVHMEKRSDFVLQRYLREFLGYDEPFVQSILDANQEAATFFALSIILNPKSAGEIRLRSTDPFDHPIIDAQFLSDDSDVKTLLRAVRLTLQFLQTEAFRRHQVEEIRLNIPECNAIDSIDDKNQKSDAYYECIIRHIVSTLFHPSGTAKMGPANDKTAVVDSRLRVHGVKGLRVADASIMPNITSGNINAPCIMIGEKAADFIKEDWSDKNHTEL